MASQPLMLLSSALGALANARVQSNLLNHQWDMQQQGMDIQRQALGQKLNIAQLLEGGRNSRAQGRVDELENIAQTRKMTSEELAEYKSLVGNSDAKTRLNQTNAISALQGGPQISGDTISAPPTAPWKLGPPAGQTAPAPGSAVPPPVAPAGTPPTAGGAPPLPAPGVVPSPDAAQAAPASAPPPGGGITPTPMGSIFSMGAKGLMVNPRNPAAIANLIQTAATNAARQKLVTAETPGVQAKSDAAPAYWAAILRNKGLSGDKLDLGNQYLGATLPDREKTAAQKAIQAGLLTTFQQKHYPQMIDRTNEELNVNRNAPTKVSLEADKERHEKYMEGLAAQGIDVRRGLLANAQANTAIHRAGTQNTISTGQAAIFERQAHGINNDIQSGVSGLGPGATMHDIYGIISNAVKAHGGTDEQAQGIYANVGGALLQKAHSGGKGRSKATAVPTAAGGLGTYEPPASYGP
jgi:hypothetical protein